MPSADRYSGKARRASSARQRSDQRALPLRACAGQEYTVVFPDYYFGQIFEARHQPGTVAYSARMQLDDSGEAGEIEEDWYREIRFARHLLRVWNAVKKYDIVFLRSVIKWGDDNIHAQFWEDAPPVPLVASWRTD